MKTKQLRRKLFFLQLFSFLVSVLPLAITVGANCDEWFTTPEETVKIAVGAIIAIVFLCVKTVGKLKVPRRIITFGLVLVISYLLESILADLVLLSGMAFIGELFDAVFFQRAIKRTRESIVIEKTADTTSAQIEELFKKYAGDKI